MTAAQMASGRWCMGDSATGNETGAKPRTPDRARNPRSELLHELDELALLARRQPGAVLVPAVAVAGAARVEHERARVHVAHARRVVLARAAPERARALARRQ